jgi:hypothetical protein
MSKQREIGDSISLLIVCGVFFCYLPIILHWDIRERFVTNFDRCDFSSSLLISAVSVSFPLSIDVIFNRDLPWKLILSRWMLLLSLIVPNLCLYLVIHRSSNTLASALLITSTRARQMLCNGGLLTIYDQSVPYQKKFRVGFVFIGILGNICQCLIPFLRDPFTERALTITSSITSICGTSAVFFSCFYYVCVVTRRDEPLSFIGKYCLVNSGLLVLNLVVKGIYRLSTPQNDFAHELGVDFIAIDSITAVLAFVVPNRMAIEEASQARVSFSFHSRHSSSLLPLLQLIYLAQKNFVRYVRWVSLLLILTHSSSSSLVMKSAPL